MCSTGESPRITLLDVVLAAVTTTQSDAQSDAQGVQQPLAFTRQALEEFIQDHYGMPSSYALPSILKFLLNERSIVEYQRAGRTFYRMPPRSVEAFARTFNRRPQFIELH